MYHAVLIDKQFLNPNYLQTKEVFARKLSGAWEIFAVKVEDNQLIEFVTEVQRNMRPNETWYAHVYNDNEMIVIFKQQVLKVTPDKSSWEPILEYGKSIGIPEEQLDFLPCRFQDEQQYFRKLVDE